MSAAVPLVPESQSHVVAGWSALSSADQTRLANQIASVDWSLVENLARDLRAPAASLAKTTGESLASRARRAKVPAHLVRLGDLRPADGPVTTSASEAGERLLSQGQVGVILVAGGQGTRLGFDHPKGLYPISPVRQATLFQLFAEQLLALGARYGRAVPWYIMTSDATHAETVAAFELAGYFGLSREDVLFFQQGLLPAFDRATGRVLMSGSGGLALSPDGHGGLVNALGRTGLIDDMNRRGITTLYYHQVDNPLAFVADPLLLGLHAERGAEVTTKVVAKLNAAEKVGLLADLDGRTEVIEYSDFPAELAGETLADGSLRFWAGNTAIHVFSQSFLRQLVDGAVSLPWHRAVKKVSYWNGEQVVAPASENAIKFERFIFDALPAAQLALVVETDRDEEFTPLKNASGDFSAEHVQRSLTARARAWLTRGGVPLPEGMREKTPIEIDARLGLTAADVSANRAHARVEMRAEGCWVTVNE